VAALTAIAAAVPFTLASGPEQRRAGPAGFFNSPCDLTHRASDDPIVFGKAWRACTCDTADR
jgi:hypothetical protein